MSEPGCVGEGTGWGTIAGIRLRVLVLADPDHAADAEAIAKALSKRHDARAFEDGGLFASFTAARAASTHKPQLIHAAGVRGAAKAAMTIAAGMKLPYVFSANMRDLEGPYKTRVLERAKIASAVILDDARAADLLRAAGIERDLYVLPPPSEETAFASAIEVVYGRILGADPDLLPDEEAPAEEKPQLVQLKSSRKAGPA